MKQRARHMALQDLANMLLPSLLEDIDTKKAVSSVPKEVKKRIDDDDDYEEEEKKKPKVVSLSLTRLMSIPKKGEGKMGAPPKATKKGKK